MVSALFSALVGSLPDSMKVSLNSSTAALFGLTSLPATSPLHAHSSKVIISCYNLVVTYVVSASRSKPPHDLYRRLVYRSYKINVFEYVIF